MKLNNRGFSLLEILMAVGLIGALAMGFMSLNSSSLKQQKAMRANLAANSLQLAIESMFAYGESCLKNFGTTPGADLIPTVTKSVYQGQIMDSSGAVVYPVGDTATFVEGGLLRIRSWDVRQKAVMSASNNDVLLEIGLSLESSPTEGYVQSLRRTINVMARLDATGKITSCNLAGSTISRLGDIASSSEIVSNFGDTEVWCPSNHTVRGCEGEAKVMLKQKIPVFRDFSNSVIATFLTEMTILAESTTRNGPPSGSGPGSSTIEYGCRYPPNGEYSIGGGNGYETNSSGFPPIGGEIVGRKNGVIKAQCIPSPVTTASTP